MLLHLRRTLLIFVGLVLCGLGKVDTYTPPTSDEPTPRECREFLRNHPNATECPSFIKGEPREYTCPAQLEVRHSSASELKLNNARIGQRRTREWEIIFLNPGSQRRIQNSRNELKQQDKERARVHRFLRAVAVYEDIARPDWNPVYRDRVLMRCEYSFVRESTDLLPDVVLKRRVRVDEGHLVEHIWKPRFKAESGRQLFALPFGPEPKGYGKANKGKKDHEGRTFNPRRKHNDRLCPGSAGSLGENGVALRDGEEFTCFVERISRQKRKKAADKRPRHPITSCGWVLESDDIRQHSVRRLKDGQEVLACEQYILELYECTRGDGPHCRWIER